MVPLAETDGVWVDVMTVGTWMLCAKRMGSAWTLSWLGHGCSARNGWGLRGRCHGWDMDALWERMGSGWTLSWLGHGCSVGTDGVCVDVIRVGKRMLCGNGRGLRGHYHGWDMDVDAPRHDGLREKRLYTTHTITPCMCKKHTTTPGKRRRVELLSTPYKPL